MSPDDQRGEHSVLSFVLVAIIVIGSLLLASRLVAGAEDEPASPQLNQTPDDTQGGAAVAGPPPPPVEAVVAEMAPAAPVAPPAPLWTAAPPAVSSNAVAIFERGCGALLYGKAEHERLAPASLTKIVTALVAKKSAPMNHVVNVQVSGSAMAKRGSSVMGLEPNMRMSVQDLLYGLFLPSGNDAAMALAEDIGGGDVGRFIDMMNAEVAALGLNDTHFANPHGLDNPALYSSAYDMAVAGMSFLNDPTLAAISVTPTYKPTWNGPVIKNGNRLLGMYPGVFGVKIGFTTKAKQTIVAAAERDGRQLVLSAFGSDDRYTDSIALFDWAFNHVPNACPR